MSVKSHVRSFSHALQFLTRLPAPAIDVFDPGELSRAALWFPVVGVIVGGIVGGAMWLGDFSSPWIAALLGLFAWVWVTGGLHLDGLADVSDALAGSHRTPERFLQILRDPHLGAFGTMAITFQLIAKVVLLAVLVTAVPAAALIVPLALLAAWARLGPGVWSLAVPPLAAGSGELFSKHLDPRFVAGEAAILCLATAWFAPILLAAVVVIAGIALFWRLRLGGVTGDCLGAGVEATETILLLLLAARMA